RVRGRISPVEEFAESQELRLVTSASDPSAYTYTTLKTAIVIYKNTDRGRIDAAAVSDIRYMIEKARLFYWINSGFKLNMQLYYHEIDDYKTYSDPGGLYYQETAQDLQELGVVNTQYDVIFRITPAINGYWSVGVPVLNLSGPARETGFSHSNWPVGTGVRYPERHDSANMGLTWIFVHEVQHALDALYHTNGYSEFYHGDKPWEFPRACGEHFSFQAGMFRHFQAYEELLPQWGEIYETADADGDHFPDQDPRVPLDEVSFSSDPQQIDTDGDGLDDCQEALEGIYWGSDPTDPDTDGDGIPDGQDPYPRYPIITEIPRFTPIIDGVIEEGWTCIGASAVFSTTAFSPGLYSAFDADWLYLALDLPVFANSEIFIDFDTDGWWWSSGNSVLSINPSSNSFRYFRSWDAGTEVKTYAFSQGGPGGMWDTDAAYSSQFKRRVIDPDQVILKTTSNSPGYQIELAIPRTPYAGLNLEAGDKIALNIVYHTVNGNSGDWATAFDLYEFVEFTLQSATAVESDPQVAVPNRLRLCQNYPNPFNPRTRIEFSLPQQEFVDLSVFDLAGRQVATLVHSNLKAGFHRVEWNGTDHAGRPAANGIYFYRLADEHGHATVKKMSLIK
ncbi:T9SS type A sorting domain-containing protein, partial [candidate division KSB1 bacterium]|nr:T9SS type A sorting domain-containing protein [candidate division KSB1 bacterium]